MTHRVGILAAVFLTAMGCDDKTPKTSSAHVPGLAQNDSQFETNSLLNARKGFRTKPNHEKTPVEPVAEPPQKIFQIVHYESQPGSLAAYLTPDPKDGKKHPAIIWITGGDCNSIGDVWSKQDQNNNQTADAYRKAGIIMMFPSMRGGNTNPGVKEGFMGEVDDVIAAGDFLAKQKYVDPKRIYLGGHSTGGTLVMLVSECTEKFRAVFSFGPVSDVRGYDAEYIPFDNSNPLEFELRSPRRWLTSIKSPTFVFEGTDQPSNVREVMTMARINKNPLISFIPVRGASHFSILGPTNQLITQKLLSDAEPACNLSFNEDEASKLFGK